MVVAFLAQSQAVFDEGSICSNPTQTMKKLPIYSQTNREGNENGGAIDWQSSAQAFDEEFGEPRRRTSARYLSLGRHSLTREPVFSVTKLKHKHNNIIPFKTRVPLHSFLSHIGELFLFTCVLSLQSSVPQS